MTGVQTCALPIFYIAPVCFRAIGFIEFVYSYKNLFSDEYGIDIDLDAKKTLK